MTIDQQYLDSHVKTLIVSDSQLEMSALVEMTDLLMSLHDALATGRISRPSFSLCLDQCLIRLQWLCLKYPFPDHQKQHLLAAQRLVQRRLQHQRPSQ